MFDSKVDDDSGQEPPRAFVERIAALRTIPTGLTALDSLLDGGLPRSGLTLVMGCSDAGRYEFTVTAALATARAGVNVHILRREAESLEPRFVANMSGLPLDRVPDDEGQSSAAWNDLLELPINFSYDPWLSLDHIDRVVRRDSPGPNLVVIDRLELLGIPGIDDPTRADLAEITFQVADLARERGVCVLLLTEVSLLAPTARRHIPAIDDLAIPKLYVRAADVAIALHHSATFDHESDAATAMDLKVIKGAHGGDVDSRRLRVGLDEPRVRMLDLPGW